MKRRIKLGLLSSILISIVGVSGCANRSAPPRCPDAMGLTCARVDQINTMVNRGQLGVVPVAHARHRDTKPFHPFSMSHHRASPSHQPLWHSEKVMEVWVAPYQDQSGNYHQASLIDTVVKPGHWINSPPQALTREQD